MAAYGNHNGLRLGGSLPCGTTQHARTRVFPPSRMAWIRSMDRSLTACNAL